MQKCFSSRQVRPIRPVEVEGKERDAGAGLLIVSTELDEVMALSDRLLVMYRGRFVAELDPTEVTNADVGLYMAGASPS